MWVSKHIIVKPYEYQKRICVDVAGIDISLPAAGGDIHLTEGGLGQHVLQTEKSQGRLPAEVIVIDRKRADIDHRRTHE